MSIANQITRINANIAAAYDACDEKHATMPQAQNSANLADTIGSIPTGAEIAEKTVNFRDYDGRVLYAYTASQIAAMSELPAAAGFHENLTFDGWNRTLAQINSFLTKHPGYRIDVGAMYHYANNDVRFFIRIPNNRNLSVPLNFSVSGGSVSVDWGDGSTTVETGTTSHTYSPSSYPAEYMIKVTVEGNASVTWAQHIFGTTMYKLMLTKAEIGFGNISDSAFEACESLRYIAFSKRITDPGNSALSSCSSLQTVVIPDSISYLKQYLFYFCTSLKAIVLPNSIFGIGPYAFYSCRALQSIVFNDPSFFSIDESAFSDCRSLPHLFFPKQSTIKQVTDDCSSLQAIIIPDSVTKIKRYAFYDCENLIMVDMTEFTDVNSIPVLEERTSFPSSNSDLRFAFSSQAVLDAFAAATNWSLFASKFIVKDW